MLDQIGRVFFSVHPQNMPRGSTRAVVAPGVPVTRQPDPSTVIDQLANVTGSYDPDYQLVTLQRLQPAHVPPPVLTGYSGRMMITYDNAGDVLGVDPCRR